MFDFSDWNAYANEKSVLEEAWGNAEFWIGRSGEPKHEDFNCGEPPFDKLRTTGSCNGTLDLSDVLWRHDESIVFLTSDEPQRNAVTGTETEQRDRFTYKGWMPSVASDSEAGSSSTERRFAITGYPTNPMKTPLYIFTLSDVRKLIKEIDALLKSGEGIADYHDCLRSLYYKRRALTWDISQNGDKYPDSDVREMKEQLETLTVSNQCPQ